MDVENHSHERGLMGIIKLDSYVLIIRGRDRFSFINGLSTNKVTGDCSTVFTNTKAKIIDHVDVIDMEEFVALVGYGPFKDNLLSHITNRILGQDVSIGDATINNTVYLSTEDIEISDATTKRKTWRGWIIVAPTTETIEENMTRQEFDNYRVENMIPHQSHEITEKFHPLACGLGHLVHEAKGCYIGQEVLVRMRSRGREGKELVRIKNPVDDATTIGKTHSLKIVRRQKTTNDSEMI